MYYAGMSVKDIVDYLEQEDIKVSHMTIYRWIEKYSSMTSDYLKGIVPRVSETWRTDEIYENQWSRQILLFHDGSSYQIYDY